MIFYLKAKPKNPHKVCDVAFDTAVSLCTAREITSEIILEWLSRLHDITGIDTEVVIELDKFLEEWLEK